MGKPTDPNFKNPQAPAPQYPGVNPTGVGLLGGQDLEQDEALLAEIFKQQIIQAKYNEWVSWTDEQYTRAKNARANFERQWYLNIAFVAGQQYVAPLNIAGQGFRLTVPKAPPHRVRLVVNKTRQAVRKETAKLTSNKPIPTVVPATGEDEDYAAAKVGESLVRTQFADWQFQGVYRQWIWWGVVCGNSFLKSWWDPNCPDYDAQSVPDVAELAQGVTLPDGSPLPTELLDSIVQTSPQLQQFLNTPKPAMGKIKYERVTPFHIYVPDLLCEDLNDQPWLIQVMTRDPLWVKNAFPESFPGDTMPSTDSKTANTIIDSVSLLTKNAGDFQDSVLVKEVWIKPNGHKDFPKGGMLTIVNDRVVQAKSEWPCPFPEFPYYPYYGLETGGFYRDSVVQDLIPLQKEYNRKRSQAIEIMNTQGKTKLLYPAGSIDPRKINTEAGQSVPYTPGYEKPTVMQGAEVPTSFSNEIATLTQEFDDISGQHDISRGDAPGDVKSGTAISFLAEQDESGLAYQVASIEDAMQLVGKHFLSYVSKYWDSDRTVKIVGRNNQYEAISWKQNALKGNTDVRIQSGSALPISKAAKQAQVTEFMQNGWLPPEEGFEMMELGGMDKVLDELMVDKRQAYRENLKMSQAPEQLIALMMQPAPGPNGEPPLPPIPHPQIPGQEIQRNWDGSPFAPQPPIPVNSWDNHEAHIMYHNNFRKTQDYETLSEPRKQAFELHVQRHQQAIMSQMINAQGAALGPNPNPPAPPDPNAAQDGQQPDQGGSPEGQNSNGTDSGGPPQE